MRPVHFLAALLVFCGSTLAAAQETLPAPTPAPVAVTQSVLINPPPPETIATPAPSAAQPTHPMPVLSVIEPQLFAVPTLRWGLFKQRLVPGTVYIQGYRIRPARVSGPFYTVH